MPRHILSVKVTSNIRVSVTCYVPNLTPHEEMSSVSSRHYESGLEKSDDSEMPCPLCNHTCSFYSAWNKKESGLCYHERQDWIRKNGPQVRWGRWLKLKSRVPIFVFTTKASGLLPRDKPSLGHLVPRALWHLGNALGIAEGCQWWCDINSP